MARTKVTLERKAPAAAAKAVAATKAPAGAKRAFRFRPGTQSLREIRRYQKSVLNLLLRLPYQRVVREVAQDYAPDMRFQASALAAMQDSTEAHLVSMLRDANAVAIHSKRVTVDAKDLKLVRELRRSGPA